MNIKDQYGFNYQNSKNTSLTVDKKKSKIFQFNQDLIDKDEKDIYDKKIA